LQQDTERIPSGVPSGRNWVTPSRATSWS